MWSYCVQLYTLRVPGLQCARLLYSRGDRGAERSWKGRGLEPVPSGTGAQTGLGWVTPHGLLRAGVPSDPRPGAGLLWGSWAESALSRGAGLCPSPGPGAEGPCPPPPPGLGASLPTAPLGRALTPALTPGWAAFSPLSFVGSRLS